GHREPPALVLHHRGQPVPDGATLPLVVGDPAGGAGGPPRARRGAVGGEARRPPRAGHAEPRGPRGTLAALRRGPVDRAGRGGARRLAQRGEGARLPGGGTPPAGHAAGRGAAVNVDREREEAAVRDVLRLAIEPPAPGLVDRVLAAMAERP